MKGNIPDAALPYPGYGFSADRCPIAQKGLNETGSAANASSIFSRTCHRCHCFILIKRRYRCKS
jgi:hypothetical protein